MYFKSFKENVNGSLVDDEVEADFDDDVEVSEVHIVEETKNNPLLLSINGSVNSNVL